MIMESKVNHLVKYFILFIIMVFVYHFFYLPKDTNLKIKAQIPNETNGSFEINIIQDKCFAGAPGSMEKFSKLWKNIKKSRLKKCQSFIKKFEIIYELKETNAKGLNFPPMMKSQLKLAFNEKDFDLLSHQKLIYVFNLLTYEQSVYNPLRSKRPLPKVTKSIWHYLKDLNTDTSKDCDFCNYIQKTATDQFGRSETLFTARMSNSFKVGSWHGMVISKDHHPVNISAEVFETMLEDAYKWSREIQNADSEYNFPLLGMDTLGKSGASQSHPHMHLLMATDRYHGAMEMLRSVALQYYERTDRSYFNDLIQLYSNLGLAVRYKSAIAMAMFTGKGDMEVMILSESPNRDLYRLFFYVTKAYRDSFQQVCYSTSMAWPPVVNPFEGFFVMPALIRILSRGNCQSKVNDMSNFDFFMMTVRSHDPWDVARAIRKSVNEDTSA